jgi:hypothetical protein
MFPSRLVNSLCCLEDTELNELVVVSLSLKPAALVAVPSFF